MADLDQTGWDMAERDQWAERTLHAYRERRRLRRGEDTWFGSGAEGLLEGAEHGLDAEEISRRRIDIIGECVSIGMADELAEMLYDVAYEEGLDPALAYELVRSGLGVAPPPDGIANAETQPATDKYYPNWLLPAVPTDDVLRERMLRMSFRRMRGKLEEHERPDEAFRAYAREPDVGLFGF